MYVVVYYIVLRLEMNLKLSIEKDSDIVLLFYIAMHN